MPVSKNQLKPNDIADDDDPLWQKIAELINEKLPVKSQGMQKVLLKRLHVVYKNVKVRGLSRWLKVILTTVNEHLKSDAPNK